MNKKELINSAFTTTRSSSISHHHLWLISHTELSPFNCGATSPFDSPLRHSECPTKKYPWGQLTGPNLTERPSHLVRLGILNIRAHLHRSTRTGAIPCTEIIRRSIRPRLHIAKRGLRKPTIAGSSARWPNK